MSVVRGIHLKVMNTHKTKTFRNCFIDAKKESLSKERTPRYKNNLST